MPTGSTTVSPAVADAIQTAYNHATASAPRGENPATPLPTRSPPLQVPSEEEMNVFDQSAGHALHLNLVWDHSGRARSLVQIRTDNVGDTNDSASDAGEQPANSSDTRFETALTPEDMLSRFSSRVDQMNEAKLSALAKIEASYNALVAAIARRKRDLQEEQAKLNATLAQAAGTWSDVDVTKLNMVKVDDVLYSRLSSVKSFATKLSTALDAAIRNMAQKKMVSALAVNSTDAVRSNASGEANFSNDAVSNFTVEAFSAMVASSAEDVLNSGTD